MRLPSLRHLLTEAGFTGRRFPLVLASAVLAAVAALGLIEDEQSEGLVRILFTSTLGIPLFTAAAVFGERRGSSIARRVAPILAAALLLLVYWVYPGWLDPVALRRYLQLSIGFHLLVAFLPYLGVLEQNGFWQYNRVLFLRFLTGALYAVVLFAGLSVALLALDRLFGLSVDDEQYARLWVLIAFVFHPWFFLGGVPGSFAELEARGDYPTGLKVFSQYILVPIVSLYLLILTSYLAKVVITRDWPSGWIGYLVSSVAAVGTLSLLLVHPVRDRTENRWVAAYSRWFYIVLFPSVIMLLVAVWKRVDQYGITENRYFLVVLSLWLAWMSLYFVLGRSKTIKAIPISLAVLALGTSFGPWGAYAVSEASQVRRLTGLLEKSGILVENEIHPVTVSLPEEESREISAVLTYLLDTHGRDSLERWFSAELDAADAETPAGEATTRARRTHILDAVHLEYVPPRGRIESEGIFYDAAESEEPWDVAGFRYAVRLNGRLPHSFVLDGARYRLEYAGDESAIRLLSPDGEELISIPIGPAMERARELQAEPGSRPSPAEPLTAEAENPGCRAKLLIFSFRASGRRGSTNPDFLGGMLLLRLGS